MFSNKLKINIFKLVILVSFSPVIYSENLIKTSPIDVTGQTINEQSYISGGSLNNKLIKFNSFKSNNSGSLLNYFTGVNSANNGGTSSMPVIRGLADDRIKIKIDGTTYNIS